MPDWLVTCIVFYCLIALLAWVVLIGAIENFDELVREHGAYRTATWAIFDSAWKAALWLPIGIFLYIRGLIKGL